MFNEISVLLLPTGAKHSQSDMPPPNTYHPTTHKLCGVTTRSRRYQHLLPSNQLEPGETEGYWKMIVGKLLF